MGFQDVAFLPCRANFSSSLLSNCGGAESLRASTCIKTVVGKYMFPVRYSCSNKASLCQMNFLKIIRLS